MILMVARKQDQNKKIAGKKLKICKSKSKGSLSISWIFSDVMQPSLASSYRPQIKNKYLNFKCSSGILLLAIQVLMIRNKAIK